MGGRRERSWAYQPLLTSYGKFRRPTASSGLCRRRFLRGKALCNPETVVGDDLGLPRAEFAGAPSCAEDGTLVAQAVPRNGCNVSFGASDERKPRDGGPAHSRKGLRATSGRRERQMPLLAFHRAWALWCSFLSALARSIACGNRM